jgi:hypothetical protein
MPLVSKIFLIYNVALAADYSMEIRLRAGVFTGTVQEKHLDRFGNTDTS